MTTDLAVLAATDAFVAALLRGGDPDVPPGCADLLPARALHHGVQGLLMLRSSALPASALPKIRAEAMAFAMWDLRHRGLLVPLLHDLAQAGVRAVLLKGTALAHGVYAASSLRPRGDTDLLIAPAMRQTATEILTAHGFHLGSDHEAERMPQEEWHLAHADGSHHAIDLHWNLLRPWALADLFATEDLLSRAIALPRLSPRALTLPPAHALLHACVHRAYFVGNAVQYGGDRLIWFHDMRLLVDRFS